jgi:4-diphosphocytidyl-2-C-methyl-D-erythritol kinase
MRAYAKVNLCLHVMSKRADGYHELRTIFQAISLYDTLELTRAQVRARGGKAAGISLETDDRALPVDRGNLVYRAIESVMKATGDRGGIAAKLKKRIPVGRGLGGGSSDAASALVGALKLIGKTLPTEQLIEMAAELGADVPFFLLGGRALGVSRGDEIYPLADGKKQRVVVVSPDGISVATKDAYQWIDEGIDEGISEEIAEERGGEAVDASLTKGAATRKLFGFCALCWGRSGADLSNDFEGPVFRRHPRLREIRSQLLEQGAAGAALAGSGSAVFGLFRSPAQARRAARAFPRDEVFVEETLTRENCALVRPQ